MRIPVPGPRDAVNLLERGSESVAQLIGAVPRMLALVDNAEQLMARVNRLIDGIEQTRTSADEVVSRTDVVVGQAEDLLARTSPLVDRLKAMMDMTEPSLVKLQPTLDRLAETTDPREVDALVGMVDLLPTLLNSLKTDVIPVLTTLDNVGPDVHRLMELAQQVNEMLASIPGVKRLANRKDG